MHSCCHALAQAVKRNPKTGLETYSTGETCATWVRRLVRKWDWVCSVIQRNSGHGGSINAERRDRVAADGGEIAIKQGVQGDNRFSFGRSRALRLCAVQAGGLEFSQRGHRGNSLLTST